MISIPFTTKRYISPDWCLTSPFGPAVREPVRELTIGQISTAHDLFLGLYRRSVNGSTTINLLNGLPGVCGEKNPWAIRHLGGSNIRYTVNLMNDWWERVYLAGISAYACRMITHAAPVDSWRQAGTTTYRCCWIKQTSRNIALSLQPGWICKHTSGAMGRSTHSARYAYRNLISRFDNMRRALGDDDYQYTTNSLSFNDWHIRELPHDHPHSY